MGSVPCCSGISNYHPPARSSQTLWMGKAQLVIPCSHAMLSQTMVMLLSEPLSHAMCDRACSTAQDGMLQTPEAEAPPPCTCSAKAFSLTTQHRYAMQTVECFPEGHFSSMASFSTAKLEKSPSWRTIKTIQSPRSSYEAQYLLVRIFGPRLCTILWFRFDTTNLEMSRESYSEKVALVALSKWFSSVHTTSSADSLIYLFFLPCFLLRFLSSPVPAPLPSQSSP